MKAQVVKQAENEQGTDTATDTADKRKKVSKRSFLTKDGSEADRMEEAAAARYTLLGGANGNIDFDYEFGKDPVADRNYAFFGFHTKTGNVANTVLNDKGDEGPGTPDDAAGAIREFQAGLAGGVWAERTGGVAGQRIDKDALAGSIIAVMIASGKLTTADEGAMYAKVRDKLESDPIYVRNSRQVPQVASEYNTRVGKQAKTVESLMI